MPNKKATKAATGGHAVKAAPSSKPAPSLESFPSHLAALVLDCPHIIGSIVAFTPRNTQRACLLVSKLMFEAAGRALYRNVYLGGRAGDCLEGFFRGALLGTDLADEEEELAKCPLARGASECTIHCRKEPASGDNSSDVGSDEGGDDGGDHGGDHGGDDASEGGPAPSPALLNIQPKPEAPAKTETQLRNDSRHNNAKRDETGVSHSDQVVNVPDVTNFKRALLKHVRVLTISTHHACHCSVYGPYTRLLLPNLDIVRVASDFILTFELLPVCDADICQLLANVKCDKLVLRNVDGNGLPLEPTFVARPGEDAFPLCKELVVFLPMEGRRLQTDFENMARRHYRSLMELGDCFPNAPDTKIVFYPTWEGWDESDDAFSWIHGFAPVTPDDIVYSLTQFLQYASPKYTIYGMGKLHWAADGDIAATFKHLFPNTQLTRRAILDMVRTELRTGSLAAALISFDGDDEFEYDPGYPECHTYKTFNEYLGDKAGRRGEINAHD